MTNYRVVDGVELVCSECSCTSFRLNNFSYAYYWQMVEADPSNTWDQSFIETDPEVDDEFSSDGYDWECVDGNHKVSTRLGDALDTYVEWHMVGPESAAKSIIKNLTEEKP